MYKNSSGSQLSQNRPEREKKVKQISYGRQLSKIKETKQNKTKQNKTEKDTVARFGVQGRRTRKSGVTSHKSAFNNKNKAQNKRKYCRCALFFSGAFFFGSSCGLSLYQRARYCPPPLPTGGALLCLSDNHWNQIQVLIIIHLPNVSPLVSKPALPLARSAFPRAPRHIPPPPVSGR